MSVWSPSRLYADAEELGATVTCSGAMGRVRRGDKHYCRARLHSMSISHREPGFPEIRGRTFDTAQFFMLQFTFQ